MLRQKRGTRRTALPDGYLVLIALPVAFALLLSVLLPRPLVLPVLSVTMLMLAVVVGEIARRRAEARRPATLSLMDVAGLLAFFSFCAGALCGQDELLALLEINAPSRTPQR